MSARAAILAALFAGVLVLGGCGGGDETDLSDDIWDESWDSDSEDTEPTIEISEPTREEHYETSAPEVRVAGKTWDFDGDLVWTNSAGGRGQTTPSWDPCIWLLWCSSDWSITVPLAEGANVITVTADGYGGTAVATIVVTRVPPPPQWSWVR